MEVILAVAVIIFFVVRIVNSSDNKKENGQNTPVAPMPAGFEQFEKIFTQEKQNDEQQGTAFDSTEGTESSEGKCIEPNPTHCVVEHSEDSVYASEIGTEENTFCHEDLVKGVIMTEILAKPKSLQ